MILTYKRGIFLCFCRSISIYCSRISHVKSDNVFSFINLVGQVKLGQQVRQEITQHKKLKPIQSQEGYQVSFAILRTAALRRCSHLTIFSSQESLIPISTAFLQLKMSVLIQVLIFLAAIFFLSSDSSVRDCSIELCQLCSYRNEVHKKIIPTQGSSL